ncbi:MAG: pyridoxal-phosphate dependent enzyme [Deltaproteobacteria bacterium]|jgi:L-serine/L-threonine ammonia-lyase|nr:pyridoxal-phosphate dependent enzyme [Deltaproteobacteria bacterium]
MPNPTAKNGALHVRTPIVRDAEVEAALRKTVWMKMECLQPVGSFKIRGIGLLCQELKSAGCTRFVSSSGGNAGYAVAYAGRELSLPVSVVVPSTTSDATRDKLRTMGAEVRVAGDVWDEADVEARKLALEEGAAYIPPFDHPTLWRGHSTMIDEVAESHGKPDRVVVTVGGGGLLCGVLEGMHRSGWSDVPVLAVETAGAESLHAAISAGEVVSLQEITSIATCLGARRVASAALEWTGKHRVRSVVVSDASAVKGCLEFANRHRILVEPACGAGLSLIYENAECLSDARRILVVVCGGIGVDFDQLNRWAAETGLRQ